MGHLSETFTVLNRAASRQESGVKREECRDGLHHLMVVPGLTAFNSTKGRSSLLINVLVE
jgi:hypothetical protein